MSSILGYMGIYKTVAMVKDRSHDEAMAELFRANPA